MALCFTGICAKSFDVKEEEEVDVRIVGGHDAPEGSGMEIQFLVPNLYFIKRSFFKKKKILF